MIEFLSKNWPWLVLVVDLVLSTSATVHAVLRKRDVRAVIGWVSLVWFSPILGAILYFLFGVNRVYRKATSLKLSRAWQDRREKLDGIDEERESFLKRHPGYNGLATLGRNLSGAALSPGNNIVPLANGDEAYPAMLEAIGQAEQSVSLLSYIFDSDRAGDAFLEALIAAKTRGVEVRVLVDDVGSKYSKPNMISRLKNANLTTASFLPTRLPRLPTANLRNHRKILVTDGRLGFTGGTNIREGHWLSLQPENPVRCLHFSLEGPVVGHLQEAFAVDWAFTTGEQLAGEKWFPKLEKRGEFWARGIAHGPDEARDRMAETIAGALAVARHRVSIVTPYFLPDAALIQALRVAALRGVDVEIFVPAQCNIKLVQWAMESQLWQVMERGCRVYYLPPPFDHTKVMVADGAWCLIGSTNWDPRSLRLNFEFNVECYDVRLSRKIMAMIDEKRQTAREATIEELEARSMPVQLRDGLARLLSPYL